VSPDGHLLGISPLVVKFRSSPQNGNSSQFHPNAWVPPISPLSKRSGSPRRSSSPKNAIRHTIPMLQDGRYHKISRRNWDETYEERRTRASITVPTAINTDPPGEFSVKPPDNCGQFLNEVQTSLLNFVMPPLSSYDPFQLPSLPLLPAFQALRLHLCPVPVLVRAFAVEAQKNSGFLNCESFRKAVQSWSPRVETKLASTYTHLLNSLFDFVLRESPRTSRSWSSGSVGARTKVDFRLLAASLFPLLILSTPEDRLCALWNMWGGGLTPKVAISALCSVAVGRAVVCMELGAGFDDTSPWRMTGGLEKFARGLVQAFLEDCKSGGDREISCLKFKEWTQLRAVNIFG